jgi:hypothetical protein
MSLENNTKYGSPNAVPDHAGGDPAWNLAGLAQERCAARKKFHEEHPDAPWDENEWGQRQRDYADIERGENLFGAMTFEPGDAFVPRGGK